MLSSALFLDDVKRQCRSMKEIITKENMTNQLFGY